MDAYIRTILSVVGRVAAKCAGSSDVGLDISGLEAAQLLTLGSEASFHLATFADSNLMQEFSTLTGAYVKFTQKLYESTGLPGEAKTMMINIQRRAALVTKLMEETVLRESQPSDWT